MADRFPLILNTSANQIQEIASGDQLDLSGNNIANAGVITATTFSGSIAGASNGILGIITAAAADIDDFVEVGSNIQLGNAGVVTATTFKGNGDFVELDVDGHTNLDNVNIAGVTTFAQAINVTGAITGTSLVCNASAPTIFLNDTDANSDFSIQVNSGLLKFMDTTNSYAIRLSINSSGNVSIAKDLDVDGHTNLDNVSIAGITTISGTAPNLLFTETDANPDWGILCSGGQMKFQDMTNTANILTLDDDKIQAVKNLDALAGIDVTGNLIASGNLTANNGTITVSGTAPKITFTETNDNPDYKLEANGGNIAFVDTTNSATRLSISSSGINVTGNGVFSGNVSVGGTLTYEDVTNIDSVGIVTARAGLKVLAGGANVVGVVTATGGVFVPDNNQIQLGNAAGSADLKIYHDTSDSIIHQDGTGDLRIRSDNSIEFNTNGTQNAIWCDSGAAVKLYYNNGLKFKTTDTGIDVTGQVVADSASFTDDGSSSPTVKIFTDDANPYALNIGNSSYNASSPFGLNFFNNNSGEGYFRHIGNGAYKDYHFSLHDNSNNKLCIKFEGDDQSVELYGRGTKDLETTGTGVVVTGVCTATSFSGDGSGLSNVGISTEQVTPSSNVATLNLAKDDHKIVASGTYTIDVSGGTEAESHTLRIENSGTANVGFSTYFKFPSGGTPSLPTASGAISLISFSVHKVGSVGIATVLLSGASVNYI